MNSKDDNFINKIAHLITDDPDIFNEDATTTSDVPVVPTKSGQKIKKYYADPVTGKPRVKGSKKPEEGEVLYDNEIQQ